MDQIPVRYWVSEPVAIFNLYGTMMHAPTKRANKGASRINKGKKAAYLCLPSATCGWMDGDG